MRYSVSNSEAVERAVATARQQTIDVTLRDGTVQTNQIAAFRRGISDTLADAVDELQAKVNELRYERYRLHQALERVRDMTYVVGSVRMNTLTMDDICETANAALQEDSGVKDRVRGKGKR